MSLLSKGEDIGFGCWGWACYGERGPADVGDGCAVEEVAAGAAAIEERRRD